MGYAIHTLISNSIEIRKIENRLICNDFFTFPAEGFALGMSVCRTSGTTGKRDFNKFAPSVTEGAFLYVLIHGQIQGFSLMRSCQHKLADEVFLSKANNHLIRPR